MRDVKRQMARWDGLVATKRWLGTDHIPGEPVSQDYSTRRTRCYELSCYAVTLGAAPEGSLLIHGTIDGGEGTLGVIGHAWVYLPDGTVWEPINGDLFRNNRSWREWSNARVHRHYTRREATLLISRHGHWGPWHKHPATATEESK